MAIQGTVNYTIGGGTPNYNVTIKENGSQAVVGTDSHTTSGSKTTGFNGTTLNTGTTYTLDVLVVDSNGNGCSEIASSTVCCPTLENTFTITGNLTPTQNTTEVYTINNSSGGNYQNSGSNNGWSISGGGTLVSNTLTTATVSVGTSDFTLVFSYSSCGQIFQKQITITPSTPGCTLSVTNVSITCS